MVLGATITLGATVALAAATWTISPGGAIGAQAGNGTVTDTATKNTTKCSDLTVAATLKSGSGLAGADAGSISAVGFDHCTSPLGETWVYRAVALPWHLNLSADHAGIVTGTVSHMRITVKAIGCTAVFDGTGATARDGTVRFRYDNATGILTLLATGGNLHTYNVTGCAGIINDNDPVTLGATLTVTPKQAITGLSIRA
jgi:hypothetical protein